MSNSCEPVGKVTSVMPDCEPFPENQYLPTPVPPLVRVGVLAAVVAISLLATYYPVFNPGLQHLYATTNQDILDIAAYAEKATSADIPRWWIGTWIQRNSYYYRPLASMLMYAEYRLWGRNFQNYCLVSWVVHALNAILLFLLVYRLTIRSGERRAVGIALLAVIIFNLRRGPEGPGWIPARVVFGEMPYWPAQTDMFSLLCALGSLLTLDLYIHRKHWGWLTSALALYIVALLFKEMALALVFAAPLLAWYRQRKPPWRVGATFVGLGVIFLVVRCLALPVAWNPEFRGLPHLLLKIAWYVNGPLLKFIWAGGYWIIPAAAGAIVIAYVIARRRADAVSTGVWLALGSLLWCLAMAQVVGGNFARLMIGAEVAALGLMIVFLGGAVVLLAARSRLAWTLAGLVAAVHLPILHVSGPHYLYWPAAFWGALNATLAALAYDQWLALRATAAKQSTRQEE